MFLVRLVLVLYLELESGIWNLEWQYGTIHLE